MAKNFQVGWRPQQRALDYARFSWFWSNDTELELYDGTQPATGPDEAVGAQTLIATITVHTTDTLNYYVVDTPIRTYPGVRASTDPDPPGWDVSYTPGLSVGGTPTWCRWNEAVNNAYDAAVGTSNAELLLETGPAIPAGTSVSLRHITYRFA